MGKKRKTKTAQEAPGEQVAAQKPAVIGSQLGDALRTAGLQKVLPDKKAKTKSSILSAWTAAQAKAKQQAPAAAQPSQAAVPAKLDAPEAARPRAAYTAAELSALGDAYRGARPIKRKSPVLHRVGPKLPPRVVDPLAIAADREARDRLGALIAGDVRFDVQLESDGYVMALRQGAARKLLSVVQSSSFAPDATLDLHGFHAPEAATRVHDFVRHEHRRGARRLLIIAGKGNHSEAGSVLGPVTRDALTKGGAAPLVQAFSSAHATLGGRGAFAVLLR